MRPASPLSISRSEKPEGERMKVCRLAIPVLTSMLPPRRVYLCAITSPTSGIRLTTHKRKNIAAVHVQTGRPRAYEEAALSRFSNQMIIVPTATTSIVLAITSGVIHGRPVQTTVVDWAEDVDKRKNSITDGVVRIFKAKYLADKFKIWVAVHLTIVM